MTNPQPDVVTVQRSIDTGAVTVSQREGIVEGLAVPWDTVAKVSDDRGRTWYDEAWERKAFDAQNLHQPANVGRVSFYMSHNEDDPLNLIGRMVEARVSREGLVGTWRVFRGDRWAQEALEQIAAGDIGGLSISADVLGSVQRGGVHVRTRGRLVHVAAVEQPAYADARMTAVRGRPDGPAPRRDALAKWLEQHRTGGASR